MRYLLLVLLFTSPAFSQEKTIPQEKIALWAKRGQALYDAQRYARAIQWLGKAAWAGDRASQKLLADLYYFGKKGVARDRKQALQWYKMAALQGDKVSQYRMGVLYNAQGHLTSKEGYKKALKWFTQSAEQGYAQAQYDLALMYKYGYGTRTDFVKAVYWLQKAADRDHGLAQCDLGSRYLTGLGVRKDLKMAFYWTQKSAGKAQGYGYCNLSDFYRFGRAGVKRDMNRVKELLKKSCDLGHDHACRQLRKLNQPR